MLGEEAQMLRKRVNLTQEELGMRWQKSRQQIGRYERIGEEAPPLVADAYRGLAIGLGDIAVHRCCTGQKL